MTIHPDVHWVVRSVGERTTEAALTLVREAAGGAPVQLIRQTPFTRAVRATWEGGQTSEKTWTVCVDADVLCDPIALRRLVDEARATGPEVFCVQGQILDYLIPIRRPAGIHLYRNAFAPRALPLIPESGQSKRPESFVNEALIDRGHIFRQSNTIIGLHDFFQDVEDLYRKGLVHAKKHTDVWDHLVVAWRERAKTEPDIRVAMMGAHAAKATDEPLRIDPGYAADRRRADLRAEGIVPKPPLPVAEVTSDRVRQLMLEFVVDDFLQPRKFTRWEDPYELGRPASPPPTRLTRLYRRVRRKLRRL